MFLHTTLTSGERTSVIRTRNLFLENSTGVLLAPSYQNITNIQFKMFRGVKSKISINLQGSLIIFY